MKISEFLKSAVIVLIIFVVFALAAFGLNLHTAPIIEANTAGAANDRLNSVMPDGAKGYEDITATLTIPQSFVDPINSSRTATIVSVNKETSGLGYVIEVAWTSEDTHGSEPNIVLVGISTDGKIVNVNNEAYHDTEGYNIFNKDPNYASSFVGQDSTLADVGIVAGSTHSSSAFRSAVNHAFEVLVLNDMITAGVKSDDQILTEMITTVAPGFTKLETIEATDSDAITLAQKSAYGTGFALLMTDGSSNYLAVVNAFGVCKLYNTNGDDVTGEHADLVSLAQTFALANGKDYYDTAIAKFEKMMPGATGFTKLTGIDTFGSIASGAEFTVDGTTYYGFYSRAYGFDQMEIFFIIDEEGKIAKMDATQFIFEEHYFMSFAGMPDGYVDRFTGLTDGTFDGSQAIIATATMTSNAVKQATNDAFDAFNSIKGGEQ